MSQPGRNAADFLNAADEEEIADVLYQYGEERQSRRVARAIVAARPLETTGELAAVVRKALGHRPGDKKDPATRTFQAVRIHVNGELDELEPGLLAAEQLLREGGRLAVVSFHSLEDRIVKRFLREAAEREPPRLAPSARSEQPSPPPRFGQLSKAIRPSQAEIERNPRARSSTLRAAIRTGAPARKERRMTPQSRIRRIGWIAALGDLHRAVHRAAPQGERGAERGRAGRTPDRSARRPEHAARNRVRDPLQPGPAGSLEPRRIRLSRRRAPGSSSKGERQLASFGSPRARRCAAADPCWPA